MDKSDAPFDPRGPRSLTRSRTYVVRVWFEADGSGSAQLRGTLSLLGGAAIGAFGSGSELGILIERSATAL